MRRAVLKQMEGWKSIVRSVLTEFHEAGIVEVRRVVSTVLTCAL